MLRLGGHIRAERKVRRRAWRADRRHRGLRARVQLDDAAAGDDELGLRGIEGDLGPEHADTFRRDLHKDLKADYVLANPPFNDSDWHGSDEDVRWNYGLPPKGNANFAWVQHFIHHLSPSGFAGFVLANGSVGSNQSGEFEQLLRLAA